MNKKEVRLVNEQLTRLRSRLGWMVVRYNSNRCSREKVVLAYTELNGAYRLINLLGEKYFPRMTEVVLVNEGDSRVRISPFGWDRGNSNE